METPFFYPFTLSTLVSGKSVERVMQIYDEVHSGAGKPTDAILAAAAAITGK